MPEEFEVTLRVCARDPDALFRAVAAVRLLGPYELVAGKRSVMHDRYFDTGDRDLMKQGAALRLRMEGSRPLLCLKGRERINEWGAISRREIEGPWSEELADRVMQAAGVACGERISFHPGDPQATLREAGLRIIQSRETVRTRLGIVPASGHKAPAVGEIALDKVDYRVADRVFVHHEIEIEAASGGLEDMVREIAALLQKAFPGTLCRWDHNKLITGFALGELVNQSHTPASSGKIGPIPEEWYAEMEIWIGKHKGDFEKAVTAQT